jgi:hypothetical protein
LWKLNITPYDSLSTISGIDVGHQLTKAIQNGYRMEKPNYAPNAFGEIMTDCWKTDPKTRPTFNQLVGTICSELESSVGTNYLNFNNPYETIKPSYVKFNEEKNDTAITTHLFGLAELLSEKSQLNSKLQCNSQTKENEVRYSLFPQRF